VSPSRNGLVIEAMGGPVSINETPISAPTLLKPGDAVKIGEASFIYEGPLPADAARGQALGYDQLFEKVKDSVVGIRRSRGLGSGFFVHASGLIVTNRHVVGYERQVSAHLADGRQLTGRVVRAFPEIDLAFVRVDGVSPVVPPFAAPATTKVGQAVLVIGHPMGLANTLTRGIISAVDREIMGNVYLQTDAAINPGNSGGPLFNEYGEVLGVATISIGRGTGLNFAVPAEQVRQRVVRLRAEESRVQQGQGVYCNACGLYSVGGAYCPGCGVTLGIPGAGRPSAPPAAPGNQCSNCGKALSAGDQFCSACGIRV
jgi:S1-C subfamily serine protease